MTRSLRLFMFAAWAAWSPALAVAQSAEAAHKEINLTAVSANVREPGSPVRIRVLRWSTDEERTPVVAALSPAAPVTAAAETAGAGAAARGRAGRAGRGGARGARGNPGAPLSPTARLTAAINRAPTLGYIWTTDVTGYSIKYAYHASLPGGAERIILATDRRLGAYSPAWRPTTAAARGDDASKTALTEYEFTLVEIHLDARGSGEGKMSLTTNVVADNAARTVALDNYAAAPAMLMNVKR